MHLARQRAFLADGNPNAPYLARLRHLGLSTPASPTGGTGSHSGLQYRAELSAGSIPNT